MRRQNSLGQAGQPPKSTRLKSTPTELPPDSLLQLEQASLLDLPSFKE